MTASRITPALLLGAALALGSHTALAFDEDANGAISKDEAMTWSKTEFENRFDGVDEVTIADFEAGMTGYDVNEIDDDGNGMISEEEWNTYTEARFDETGQDEMELTGFEDWVAQGMQ